MSILTRKPTYRLKGNGADPRGYLTRPAAEQELIDGDVPYDSVTRRQAINGYGKLGCVPYTVFPLAEIEAWVEKGALDWSWVKVWIGNEHLTWEEFLTRRALEALNGRVPIAA